MLATEITLRTPGNASRSAVAARAAAIEPNGSPGSNANSPTRGVAPPNRSSVRSNATRTGSSSLKKKSWSGLTVNCGIPQAPKATIVTLTTIAGTRVRTARLSPVVTAAPRMAFELRSPISTWLIAAGSEKNEMMPANVMPIAVKRPS